MKLNLQTTPAVVLLAFLIAVSFQASQAMPLPITGTITFTGSGVILNLGEGWYRYQPPAGAGVFVRDGKSCGPILANNSGMLTVNISGKTHNSLKSMTAMVRAECDTLRSADKRSFRSEEFITEGGFRGLHVSYTQKSVRDGGTATTQCHHYLFTNRNGRGTDIAYFTNADHESKPVDELIRKTLKLG